jgi:hypothetical protein
MDQYQVDEEHYQLKHFLYRKKKPICIFFLQMISDLPGTLKTVDCPGEYPAVGIVDIPEPYVPKPVTEFGVHTQDNGIP